MIGTTGATGAVGGALAARLAGAGLSQRLLVRDPSRAPILPGAEIAHFRGYDDVAGMRMALAGVSTLFLASAHESADRLDQHKLAVDAAVAGGVERIVYLSFVGARADATFTLARDHFHTEEHIRGSGVQFTFSRQNLYMDMLPALVGDDSVIRGPAGEGRFAAVSREDVADALMVMVSRPGHEGRTYNLTGPQALNFHEVATELSRHSGRDVSYQDETLRQAKASRASYGAPEWQVEAWISTYSAIAAGDLAALSDDVARLCGHEPVSLSHFLNAT